MALVKLYPYNRRMGWVMQSYTHTDGKRSTRFVAARGWYEVSDEMAECLKSVPQQDRFPLETGGRPAFLICADQNAAKDADAKIDMALNKHVDDAIGTADAPVRATRPGTIQEPVPRTRSRKRTRGE